MNIRKFLVAAAATTLAMSAQAAFINGSISFIGGFENLPAAPTNSVVGLLSPIDPAAASLAVGGTGDLVGANGAAVSNAFLPPNPAFVIYQAGGFTFTVTSIEGDVSSSPPMDCVASQQGGFLCDDDRTIDIRGFVSQAGFDDTGFNGVWTGNGACNSDDGTNCIRGITGSWSASLVSTGTGIPEPGALALVGMALAGLGLARRRRAA